MKKIILAVAVAAAFAVPAVASAGQDQANYCGAQHGAFANVNQNFGWLGADGGAAGYHGGNVGQTPGATGYNNAAVCSQN